MLRKFRSLGTLALLAVLGTAFSNTSAAAVSKQIDDADGGARTSTVRGRYDAQITIAVFNDAEISHEIVAGAEKTAGKIFLKAGIRTVWLNCDDLSGYAAHESPCSSVPLNQRFDVRIVHDSMGLRSSVLGIAFLSDAGAGRQADVFYDGIARIRRESNIDAATLLGHVTAHEIGHLLLGANSHALSGLMRASWTREELFTASRGELLFSKSQSERIKARLPLIFSATFVAGCGASAC
jgi:hypothetical protein